MSGQLMSFMRMMDETFMIFIIIGLLLIERPVMISRLILKLVQIGRKAPPPPQQVLTLVRSLDINFSRPIFIYK